MRINYSDSWVSKSIIITLLVFISFSASLFCQNLDLSFNTKDYQDLDKPLINRLDDDKNYIIAFSAFWCIPCVKNINEIYSKNIEKYREEFNLEIILLDHNNFDTPRLALNKMKRNQWYFDMYFVEERYTDFGVFAIPAYFFKPAKSTKATRLPNNNFERAVEQHYANQPQQSIFNEKIAQSIINKSCNKALFEFGIEVDTVIDNLQYYKISDNYYRSGLQSKSIYRFNPITNQPEVILDMTLDVCDEFKLIDHEGDAVIVTIESINESHGYLELITDVDLFDNCSSSIIPFTISEAYGCNAGIHFNIEDGEIVTKLACQNNNSNTIFSEPGLTSYCIPSNVEDNIPYYNIELKPNPAHGRIKISSDVHFNTFRILNQLGQLIKIGNLDQTQEVDIISLNEGTYFLKLQDELGKRSITKFIKM